MSVVVEICGLCAEKVKIYLEESELINSYS